MAWINRQAFWFLLPDFTDVFIGSKSLEGFEAFGEVIGHQDTVEMLFQMLMRLVIVFLDWGFFSCSVHALDLAIGPGVIGVREPVFNGMFITDTCKDMCEGRFVVFPISDLDPVIGQNDMDAIGHGRDQMTEELCGGRFRGAWMQLRIGELRGAVDGHEWAELSCFGPHFGEINVEVSERVPLELVLLGRVSLNPRQPTKAMALPTLM